MLFLVDVHVDSMTGINAFVPCDIAVIQTLDARAVIIVFYIFDVVLCVVHNFV